jgi:hypothetical protein
MVVDIANIQKVYTSQSSSIGPLAGPAVGTITTAAHNPRTTLYDPLWGYIDKFGQSFGFQHSGAKTYSTLANFVITGTFTRDGEQLFSSTDDTAAFNALIAKYNALEAAFENAGDQVAPEDFADWGGLDDPRCIALPQPLIGDSGKTVFGLPVQISIIPGLWPNWISYRAVLQEAKFPTQKIAVNGFLLDQATISIDLPSPILSRKRLVGCTGEIIQVLNYTCLGLQVSGKIPRPQNSGDVIANDTCALIDSIAGDDVEVQIINQTSGPITIFTDMDPEVGGGIDATSEAFEDVVTIRMKAKV